MASISSSENTGHEDEAVRFGAMMKEQQCEGYTVFGSTEKPYYLPDQELSDYLDDRRLLAFLQSLSKNEDSRQLRQYVKKIRSEYLKVFAILAFIGKGRYITTFIKYKPLSDRYLPFTERPNAFPYSQTVDFFEIFQKQQWFFCAWNFGEFEMEQSIDEYRILPFKLAGELGRGGFAKVFEIKLHPDYDGLRGTDTTDEPKSMECRYPNVYVLKIFRTKDARRDYEAEVKAFQLLKNGTRASSIIDCLGSFEYKGTFSIILDYADLGNLDDYFRYSAPTGAEHIFNVWKSFLHLIHAICEIHNIKPPEDNENDVVGWVGFHQDIVPRNILVFSRSAGSHYDVDFKLGDLGLCHFSRRRLPGQGATIRDIGGTREYGPPEAYRRELMDKLALQITPKFDIWSMGCVLSEFAVYIVHGLGGHDGVRSYREARSSETTRIHHHQDTGCFHDTVNVLDSVASRHRELPSHVRAKDFVTTEVIDKLIIPMLVPEKDRGNAGYFWDVTTEILRDGESKLRKFMKTPETVQETSDDAVPSRPRPSLQPLHTHMTSRSRHNSVRSQNLRNMQPILSEKDLVATPTADSDLGRHESTESIHSSPAQLSSPSQHQDPWTPRTTPTTLTHSRGHSELSPRPKKTQHSNRPSFGESLPPTPIRDSGGASGDSATSYRFVTDVNLKNVADDTHSQTSRTERHSSSGSKRPGPKRKLPRITFGDAKEKRNKKELIGCENMVEELIECDVLFLVDDARSMQSHWDVLVDLVHVMAYELKSSDSDGMDLKFINSPKVLNSTKSTALRKDLQSHVLTTGKSSINKVLDLLLEEYVLKLRTHTQKLREYQSPSGMMKSIVRRKPSRVKPLYIYIFTDGKWGDSDAATETIRETAKYLKKFNYTRRQLGIEIIRFGDDPDAKKRLKALDDLDQDLPDPLLDVVDTTSVNGNFIKMLLGAVRDDYDMEESDSDIEATC